MKQLLIVILNIGAFLSVLIALYTLYSLTITYDIEVAIKLGLETLSFLLLSRVLRGYVDALHVKP